MSRKAIQSLTITESSKIKSHTIYVIVSASYPTMAFWSKAEAERVISLTLQNMPKSATVKPRLHKCELY